MSIRAGITLVVVLGLILIGLAVALVVIPVPVAAPEVFVSEHVRVAQPLQGTAVQRAFTVEGEARGPWFFEASFPIFVVDENNEKVGQGIAQAQGEWMTEDFVPFVATVTVQEYTGPATLVLLKDNPSGLPEHDDAVEFSIVVQ